MKLLISGSQMRQLGYTRPAPSRPKIEHNQLAFVTRRKIHILALRGFGLEAYRLLDCLRRPSRLSFRHCFRRLLQFQCGAGRGQPRDFVSCAAYVERFANIEPFVWVEVAVAVEIEAQVHPGTAQETRIVVLPAKITGRQVVGQEDVKLLAAKGHFSFARIIGVIEKKRPIPARRVAFVDAIHRQMETGLVLAIVDEHIRPTVVPRRLFPVLLFATSRCPRGSRIISQVAVDVGIDEEARGFSLRFVHHQSNL